MSPPQPPVSPPQPPETTVEVLPDVSGIDRTFAYTVPASLAGQVRVGTIVRVVLHGRRVRAWVVATGVEAPPGVALRPLEAVASLGPTPELVELSRWAAWRFAGPTRPLLVASSPGRLVRVLPPSGARAAPGARGAPLRERGAPPTARPADELVAATAEAMVQGESVLRLPPGAPRLAVVEAALGHLSDGRGDGPPNGDLLVLAASTAEAATLAARLARAGRGVALYPDGWASAAAGGRTVVGARGAALAPVGRLGAVLVLDAHADAYRSERVPTWDAPELVAERAHRAKVPLVLVSPCPTVELLAGRRLVTLSREAERDGWAPLELLDARGEDPRTGGYPSRLASLVRDAAAGDPGRPVVAVLNRTGRARLLACGHCRSLLRCEVCGGALVQLERPAAGAPAMLSCPRCGTEGRATCPTDGPTRPRIVRAGVARARDDLAALVGLDVAEVSRASLAKGEPLPGAPVLVGTEAVLHRARSASLVAFLDFDHELLAPRFRAGEQALALLALAARLVGGRRRGGRVVVRTRLVDHEVLTAAVHADPSRLTEVEGPRRRLLRLPPATALGVVSGTGADEFVERLRAGSSPSGTAAAALQIGGSGSGRYLLRAAGSAELADALAAAGPPGPGTRIEIDPRDV